MKHKTSTKKIWPIIALVLLVIISIRYWANENGKDASSPNQTLTQNSEQVNHPPSESAVPYILKLTNEKVVIAYLRKHHRLPDYYITKSKAKRQGWIPAKGNLCDVLPGRAIGGDHFGNREGRLPKLSGRKYIEADINYNCGRRNADRLIYSNDGLIYITKNHYKTFQRR